MSTLRPRQVDEYEVGDFSNWMSENRVVDPVNHIPLLQDFMAKRSSGNPINSDYDYVGAYKGGLSRDKNGGHFKDTYKYPWHDKFSTQSKYYEKGMPAIDWSSSPNNNDGVPDITRRMLQSKDLYDYWLDSNEKTPLGNVVPDQDDVNAKPRWLTPEASENFMQSFSPFQLYQNPGYVPYEGRPINAYNYDPLPGDVGPTKRMIGMIGRQSKDPWIRHLYRTIPESNQEFYHSSPDNAYERPSTYQSVYEHEIGHYWDPRLSHATPVDTDKYPTLEEQENQAFMNLEWPAIVREEAYLNHPGAYVNNPIAGSDRSDLLGIKRKDIYNQM